VIFFIAVKIFYCKLSLFCKKPYVVGGNGGHFWIQHPRKHKVYQKYSMQLKKKIFLQTCVINDHSFPTKLTLNTFCEQELFTLTIIHKSICHNFELHKTLNDHRNCEQTRTETIMISVYGYILMNLGAGWSDIWWIIWHVIPK
jgi:hypothetical protein